MKEKTPFGKKLFEYQCANLLTGKELADRLGISSDKLSKFKRANPNKQSKTVSYVATKLGLPVSYFIQD